MNDKTMTPVGSEPAAWKALQALECPHSDDAAIHIWDDAIITAMRIILASQTAERGEAVARCCGHSSDCAVHNAPALPPGPCDCKPKIVGESDMHWFESAFVAWESGDIIGAIDGLNEAIAHFSGAALQSVRPPAGVVSGDCQDAYFDAQRKASEINNAGFAASRHAPTAPTKEKPKTRGVGSEFSDPDFNDGWKL